MMNLSKIGRTIKLSGVGTVNDSLSAYETFLK